jgi:hypothetical protein
VKDELCTYLGKEKQRGNGLHHPTEKGGKIVLLYTRKQQRRRQKKKKERSRETWNKKRCTYPLIKLSSKIC